VYFIKSYWIKIPATCFDRIYRAIFRLICRLLKCAIDNAFDLQVLVIQKLVKTVECVI